MKAQILTLSAALALLSSSLLAEETEMVLVPAGEFLMGSDTGAYDEKPARTVYLDAYWIDKREVSNAQFASFARNAKNFETLEGSWFRYSVESCLDLLEYYETQAPDALGPAQIRRREAAYFALGEMLGDSRSDWKSMSIADVRELPRTQSMIAEQAKLPVRGVAWRDASRYAQWAGKRLPTEAEWEKAARGPSGLNYPWGDNWQTTPSKVLLPVDDSSLSSSPLGCQGMSGNVWEWVEDWYGENYYANEGSLNNPKGPEGLPNGELPSPFSSTALLRSGEQGREDNTRKVIRGGGFGGPDSQNRFNFRCSRRLWSNPNYWHADLGFRCAKDSQPN